MGTLWNTLQTLRNLGSRFFRGSYWHHIRWQTCLINLMNTFWTFWNSKELFLRALEHNADTQTEKHVHFLGIFQNQKPLKFLMVSLESFIIQSNSTYIWKMKQNINVGCWVLHYWNVCSVLSQIKWNQIFKLFL